MAAAEYPAVSAALQVPNTPAFAPVREALEAIDHVHSDGTLPRLPVILTRSVRESGGYRYGDRGTALGFRISRMSEWPHLTVVHEIGHFLDHQALARPGVWASSSGNIALVMSAIGESQSVRRLRELLNRRTVTVTTPSGLRTRIAVDGPQVRYYLDTRELFARAYAQWVTQRANDRRLQAQLDRLRDPNDLMGVYHSQSADDDFQPISLALEELFLGKGWLR